MGDRFIKLPLDELQSPLFAKRRRFSEWEAWAYILLKAYHFDSGDIKRGTFPTSYDILAKDWGWDRKAVINFIRRLERGSKVVRTSSRIGTILAVVNWDLYNGTGTTKGTTTGTTGGTTTGTLIENKERRIKNKDTIAKVAFAEFVSLTPDEHAKLVEAHGEAGTKRLIEILDNYKGSTGKKYTSDYRTILNWVVKRYKEEQEQAKKKPASSLFKSDILGFGG